MASAWGAAFGQAWGDAWGRLAVAEEQVTVIHGGGPSRQKKATRPRYINDTRDMLDLAHIFSLVQSL